MIGELIEFYEKMEKEMSALVRSSPSFSLFAWKIVLTHITQRIGFQGKTEKVIKHLTKSRISFPNL